MAIDELIRPVTERRSRRARNHATPHDMLWTNTNGFSFSFLYGHRHTHPLTCKYNKAFFVHLLIPTPNFIYEWHSYLIALAFIISFFLIKLIDPILGLVPVFHIKKKFKGFDLIDWGVQYWHCVDLNPFIYETTYETLTTWDHGYNLSLSICTNIILSEHMLTKM